MKHKMVLGLSCMVMASCVHAAFVPRTGLQLVRLAGMKRACALPMFAQYATAVRYLPEHDHEIHDDHKKPQVVSEAGDHDDWPEHKKEQLLDRAPILPDPAVLAVKSEFDKRRACLVEAMNLVDSDKTHRLQELQSEIDVMDRMLEQMKTINAPGKRGKNSSMATSRVQAREFSTYTNPSSFRKEKPDRLEGLTDQLRKTNFAQQEIFAPLRLASSYMTDCARIKEAVASNNLNSVKSLICGALFTNMYSTGDHIKHVMLVLPDAAPQAVLYLLERGYTVFQIDRSLDTFGTTALAHATQYRQMQLIEKLLEQGADYDKRNMSGISPFDIACAHDKIAGNHAMKELFEKYIPRGV